MNEQPNAKPRLFKIGATTIVEDASTAGLTNEQVRAFLKTSYPEVANATIRETDEAEYRCVHFLAVPGRKG